MSHPSKIKGNKFERDVVKKAELFEIDGKRAWASDGRSLGLDPEVDVVIGSKKYKDEMHIQCKSESAYQNIYFLKMML